MMGRIASFLAVSLSILVAPAAPFAPPRKRPPPARQLQSSSSSADALPPPSETSHHDELLWRMARFLGEDMVDSRTNRFYYLCRPQEGKCEHVHFPMRDLAAAWDAAKALQFIRYIRGEGVAEEEKIGRVEQRLVDAIKCTMSYYISALIPNASGAGMHLSEEILLEPPTIGHSALLLLGLCDAFQLTIFDREEDAAMHKVVSGLVAGILSMQQENGAFGIGFGNGGAIFCEGSREAMLSLMAAHELSSAIDTPGILSSSTQQAIISALERAFVFYSKYYYAGDADINFNIWQVMAFARYHDALDHGTAKDEVRRYVLDMCEDICNSRSWRHQLARGQSFYPNLDTVEIACGLDALAEGMRIARSSEDEADLAQLLGRHARNAAYFLLWAQERVLDDCTIGRGGLGYGGVQVLEQRLDVTGHAVSALTKLRNLSVTMR